MRRWVVAFVLTSSAAAAMLAGTMRGKEAVAARSTAELSDIDVELLLTKLREADLLAIQKNIGGARSAWTDVRRRGAGIWTLHEGLGDSLRRAGLRDEALKEYGTAIELAPPGAPRAAVAAKKGRTLAELERHLDAVRVLLEACPFQGAGTVLELAERAGGAEAVRLCRIRAEADPRVYPLLAELCRRLSTPAEAAEARARYFIRVEPWNEALARTALDGLGVDLAVEVCRAWARAVPGSLEAWKRMGDVLRAAGRDQEALAAYTSMVDVRPGQAEAHRSLAAVFRELGRMDDAGTQLEAARRARPEDRQTWLDLVAHYEAAGSQSRADRVLMEGFVTLRSDPALRPRYVALRRRQLDQLSKEEALALRKSLAAEGFPELGLYDLKVVVTWDVATDVDLDVYEPGGERICHSNAASKNGGRYYVDDTQGTGPETYTLPKAAPGSYKVGVHLHGDRRATAKIDILLYEGTPRERRWTSSLTLEKSGQELLLPSFEVD
jgi:tetratricopeptide (TPR) repeat protein